jgi:hypothetical protein
METAVSGLEKKRNNLSREGEGEGFEDKRSYSSIMFWRSSSVETVMRLSRSSLGRWYLRVNDLLP